MKILFILAIGAIGLQANAQVSSYDCQRELSFSDDRRECRQIIRSARGGREQSRALEICLKHEVTGLSKLSCMRQIAHANFDRNALNVCEYNLRFDMNKPDCCATKS